MSKPALTISRIAKLSGLGIETLRYYQRIGLIEEPPKPARGYRVYPPALLERLQFIQRAKQLGFTLAEIKDLLALEQTACGEARELAQLKIALIQQKIADLQAMTHELETLLDACRTNPTHQGCPIIKTLAGE